MNTYLKTGDRQPGTDCVSSIVQLGDFFYISGQHGWGDSFKEQCINCCYTVLEVLQEFDLRFDHIMKFTVYLTDYQLKDEFLSVFSNFVEAPYPAVTIVEVSDLGDSMICMEGCGINTLRHERPESDEYFGDMSD